MTNLHQLDVSSVSTLDMEKETLPIYITLDEVVKEALLLLSPYALNITSEIPVFTSWGARDLKGNMAHLKNYYLSKQHQSLVENSDEIIL